MNDESMQVAMATWAAKDIPARLHAAQVAKLLNCTTDDVAILASAGKLRALGKPKPNAVKFFSGIELILLLADRGLLDEVTKTISQYWRRKNGRRKTPNLASLSEDNDGEKSLQKPSTKPSTISSTTELKTGGHRPERCSERIAVEIA